MAESLIPILSVTTAILTFLAAGVTFMNSALKKENNQLKERVVYLQNFNTSLQQDYSQKVTQYIQQQREIKKVLSTEHLLRKHFPNIFFYLYFLIYLLVGWIIGNYYDAISVIKDLFRPILIFTNPAFWIVIISLTIFILLPLIPRRRIIRSFPHKFMELPEEKSLKQEGD